MNCPLDSNGSRGLRAERNLYSSTRKYAQQSTDLHQGGRSGVWLHPIVQNISQLVGSDTHTLKSVEPPTLAV